jgi:cytochrome c biogenesis protein CcmG, thiol:disulfide interchange protein DsbE
MNKKKLNLIIYIAIIAYLLVYRAPQIWDNFQKQGQVLSSHEVEVIGENRTISFPPSGPAILIYWATWCAPCKLEMDRLQKSVETGKIPKDKIFAISLSEDTKTIEMFLKKNNYKFTFINDPEHDFEVQMTPTTALLKDGVITSFSTGMSLIGIWRAEALFW